MLKDSDFVDNDFQFCRNCCCMTLRKQQWDRKELLWSWSLWLSENKNNDNPLNIEIFRNQSCLIRVFKRKIHRNTQKFDDGSKGAEGTQDFLRGANSNDFRRESSERQKLQQIKTK